MVTNHSHRCRAPLALVFIILASRGFASDAIPGAPQKRPIALVGATIHPVDGPVIEGGTLLFDKGKIIAVGRKVDLPDGAERVGLEGKHVYPALFDAMTDMGLIEIGAVRATRDQAEVGQINPNARAEVAVNPDSEIIPVTRSNGVLLTLTAPSGGLICGTSAVLQLDGWTWEDMTLTAPVALHINWPRIQPVSNWWIEQSRTQQAAERDKALVTLEKAIADAQAYAQARSAPGSTHPRDSRWEAMLPVLDGRVPVIIEADEVQQIQSAVAFAQRHGLKMILYGGYDAIQCADLLRKHDVPVIVGGVYRLPRRRSDDYDAPYTLPERLRAAGLTYCIAGAGRHGASNVRNLPYHAATAAAYGLPRDEALRAITLYPAQILGVADRVGSLAAGKDATLFITDGDPLDTPTQVEAAFIQGRRVDLTDRHKQLWHKYQQKYEQQRAESK